MSQKQWTPPTTPREWVITIDHPRANTMASLLAGDPAAQMTSDEADAHARTLPIPDGWYVVGCQQVSKGARGPILPTDARQLRVILWPMAWRERYTPVAPLAVYAAAQVAGLRTKLDTILRVVSEHQWQHYYPDGRPASRGSADWDCLPTAIRDALAVIWRVADRRRVGYMWRVPMPILRARRRTKPPPIPWRGKMPSP